MANFLRTACVKSCNCKTFFLVQNNILTCHYIYYNNCRVLLIFSSGLKRIVGAVDVSIYCVLCGGKIPLLNDIINMYILCTNVYILLRTSRKYQTRFIFYA